MFDRRFILKSALFLPSASLAAKLESTIPTTAGPFYPATIPLDADADLTQVQGKEKSATGVVANLTGVLSDQNGCAIKNAKIEIWQCDAFGAYHHPRDRGNIAEPEFQGYGFTQTDLSGAYRFKTITPVSYPGRTPHIHVRVSQPGMELLTTQLYLEDEPSNERDFLFNRIPPELRALHTAKFPKTDEESEAVTPIFNIVLNKTQSC